MEFSSEALCRERQGGGITQTCAHCGPEWLRLLLLHRWLTLCQGFSTAIPRVCSLPRAQDISDSVVTSHVMAGVSQLPIWSITEWHPFIASPPTLPKKCPAQTQVLRDCQAQDCFHTALILAWSLFILCQYSECGWGSCFSPSSSKTFMFCVWILLLIGFDD